MGGGRGSCCCCGDGGKRSCSARQTLYVTGLCMLAVGTSFCLIGFFSPSWVYREGGNSATKETVEHYGLWTACSPPAFDLCQHVFDALPDVEGGARGSQALITLAILFYMFCTTMEIISCCPLGGLRRKLSIIFDNHIVEYIVAVAAVVGFFGMLIFAAEVKNKAPRDIGQTDYTGGGFSWSLSGQIFVVLGCCLLACGRNINNDKIII